MGALGDPTRRAILARLASGPATVGELAAPFRISQQAISKHVAYLERARLVAKARDGRRHVCSLTASPLREAADWIAHYRRFWDESLDRLDEYLRELQDKDKEKNRGASRRPHPGSGARALSAGSRRFSAEPRSRSTSRIGGSPKNLL